TFQIMIKKLLFANLNILTVLSLHQIMLIIIIIEHPNRLTESPQRCKHLYSLIPGHSTVTIIMHNNHRRIYLIQMKERRVLDIKVKILPQGRPNTALRMLVLKLSVQTTCPTDTAISGRHVHDRCTRPCGRIHICARNQMSNLIAAPALSLNSDMVTVNKWKLLQSFYTRVDIDFCGFTRITFVISNVRRKYQITITHKKTNIQTRWSRSSWYIAIQSITQFLIEINNHRILFIFIKVLRFV